MNAQSHRRLVILASTALIAALVAALAVWWFVVRESPEYAGSPPLAGADIGGPFRLLDQEGRLVTDQSFSGRYRLVYFGYSYCPDVCPLDLQKVTSALNRFEKQHPDRAATVQPIFITVDPQRDTPATLKAYMEEFHPRMVALTGSPEMVADAMKAYRVYAQRQGPPEATDYLVDHMAMVYLMGPQDDPITFFSRESSVDEMVKDLETYVR